MEGVVRKFWLLAADKLGRSLPLTGCERAGSHGLFKHQTVTARPNDSKWKPDKLKEEKSFKTTAGNLIYHWNEGEVSSGSFPA